MKALGKAIVKARYLILILSVVLLIPAGIAYVNTRVNYDILSYLPGDIDTMVGQDILVDQFGTGAFSMYMVQGMEYKDVAKIKEKIELVEHVKSVIWYDSFMDLSVPVEFLPEELTDAFNNGDCTLMVIMYDTTMSADETMQAVTEIRRLSDQQCFLSGMSAIVTDTKELCDAETPIYVLIAVLLSVLVLSLTMDSYIIPLFFLLSIGMAIIFNLGTNLVMGEISYVTKALAAVLQLGVTMDYSIFLWHSYEEFQKEHKEDKKKAMADAISATFSSVAGSSVTTVAGFIALCFMSFTLGLDLGVVMAKGVVIGVICCVTVLPSLILVFDRLIEKTKHKPLIPQIDISGFVVKHYKLLAVLFLFLWIPAVIGYQRTDVYYNLDSTLPETLPGVASNQALNDKFHMNTMHIILADSSMEQKDVQKMTDEMKQVDGIKAVLGLESMLGPAIPVDFIPEDLTADLKNENYQMMLLTSEYPVASDEVNEQCEILNRILKSYDEKGLLIGEAPCTKDLIEITNTDFNTVNTVSIGVILVIIAFVFGSVSLPVILVFVIEFAIYLNMGIPYYTNTTIPFIASIVIGTIQLGSTIDYAILMTNRYKLERSSGADKKTAVGIAHKASLQSIFVSAMSFFAATFGVGVYSDIDMISSLCTLMARGAIISMFTVLLVLPSMLILFDGLIRHTSLGFRKKQGG
ncbi:MAG: MMPL family transporter [Lachnospiraceae bacterium]|nr:MMPL family transporter [Lachnospiraceae bacterium]